MPSSDAELVLRARTGDTEAFGELVNRYIGTISVLAYQKTRNRADAEDVAQEAFVRAHRRLDQLKDPERFGAWIYHIAFRASIDSIRKRSGRRAHVSYDELAEQGFEARAAKTEDSLLAAERSESLRAAIDSLPDHYRVIILLRYMKKMSYREIAEHLQEPEGTIANRLHRATKILRKKLATGAELP